MKRVDLNVDIGEGFPHDEELLEFATSANICCGEHAGSAGLTHHTVEICIEKGVRYGAHTGFPDRDSMGRRIPSVEEIQGYELSLIAQPKRVLGGKYVKPHGAFYNVLVAQAFRVSDLTKAAWEIAIQYYESGWSMMLMDRQNFEWASRNHFPAYDTTIIREGFADRAYRPDGTLVPRSEPGAVLEDPEQIRQQVLDLAPKVDSICLHGDTPNCLEFAEIVFKTLVDAGYEVGY